MTFSSHNGEVLFEGRPISMFKVREARRALASEGLDLPMESEAFRRCELLHDRLCRSEEAALAFRRMRAD